MARCASVRVAAGALLPRRLHLAGAGGRDRVPEQARGVRHPVPRCGRCDARHIAADPKHLGAEIGAVALLHTWGQTLHQNPHS